MQVLCMVTAEDFCDVQCPCCQQKYVVYYSRLGKAECEEALRDVRDALLAHHVHSPLSSAHPADAFNVPAWNGPAHSSAAALLSGAPVRRPGRPRLAPLAFASGGVQHRRVS